MATLSNPVFYYNQSTQATGSAAGYVGWGGNSSGLTGNYTRIVRYTLTTGANDSATSITIKMFTDSGSGTLKWKEGSSNISDEQDLTDVMNGSMSLYFIIGTSATEHIAAGKDYITANKYTGKVYLDPYYDLSSSSSHSLSTLRFHVQLDGEYTLAPNKTYYVWIFPGFNSTSSAYSVYRWDDGISSSHFRYQILLDGVPEGAVYIDSGVAELPNPGPFTTTDSWNKNQSVTISVNNGALKVLSNQTSSTPGAYTTFTTSIPSGDTFTLTYTARGNVQVMAYLYKGTSEPIFSNSYTQLTNDFQTFTLTKTTSKEIDTLYFFMTGVSTSSWFEIGSINIDCSTTSWKPYQVYIDNGSSWDLYQAYIDNGSSWDTCK